MDLHDWMTADLASARLKLFDSVIGLVPTQRWHEQADGGGTTIAGLLLHVARHQDLAVNTVIRNHDPLFATHAEALGLADALPGVALPEKEDLAVTNLVAHDSLLAYVTAVFDGTQQWLAELGNLALDIEPNCGYRLTHKAGLTEGDFPPVAVRHVGRQGAVVARAVARDRPRQRSRRRGDQHSQPHGA